MVHFLFTVIILSGFYKGNCFICWNYPLFFRIWLVSITRLQHTAFTIQISRINRSVLKMMFLYWIFCKYWNIIGVYWQYTTRNLIIMFRWLTSILILWRRDRCMSNLSILFIVTIICRWIKWPLLFSTKIIGVSCSLLWTSILFRVISWSQIWLTVVK